MEEITLIANSGIHFKTTEAEIDLNQPLSISGKMLKYTFLEVTDFINMGIKLDVCCSKDGRFSTCSYLASHNLFKSESNGLTALDECGVPKIKDDTVMNVIESYDVKDPNLLNINSLSALRFNIKVDGQMVSMTGFEMLFGKWLPMPMYEYEENGYSTKYPNGWCRVRIDDLGVVTQGSTTHRCRFTWAFDTKLAENTEDGKIRPAFLPGSDEKKPFMLCNRPDLLLGGFITVPDGHNDAPIGDYLASLWNIDLTNITSYKFLAYYVYLINYIRCVGAAPSATLYHKTDMQIPVDMSIDIGNSRTCAVLFENGDFTKARMLRLMDLSQPWRSYENAFDMRVVFRKADFGGDLTMDKKLFLWPSVVRVGEEAKHLIYHSLEGNDESQRSTNYSSPKRYLWDDRLYNSRWEMMVVDDDPTNVKVAPQIYMDGFTDYFDNDGTYLEQPKPIDLFDLGSLGKDNEQCHYSRRSLMTFVMVEILQHAISFINSSQFRENKDGYGNVDCYRYLRNIIVTCPTAMPIEEQIALRKAAKDAASLMRKLTPSLPEITITPDPENLLPPVDGMGSQNRGWLYDEAFASQLVFLYAELQERYGGQVDHFFKLKGHEREEVGTRYNLPGKSLTIGTIDIGAGTTDVMITVYGQKGKGKIVPIPMFYDSFYTAGDDILHNIISQVILEGKDSHSTIMGSISSVLSNRIHQMSPDEIMTIQRVANGEEYRNKVAEIRQALNADKAAIVKNHLINELMHRFFGDNTAGMSSKDRRCRLDFCTQVTHPLSQFFLEALKQGLPTRVYTYDEIFPTDKPAQYLLDHFEYHFGFRFEEILWRFDPEEIAEIVRSTMQPVVKALSEIVFQHNCDFLVLSGRPTNLKPLTELFLEHIPVAPNRMISLNQYRVGSWFPLSTGEGYFMENQKAVVAVGAEVGYLANDRVFKGLALDFSVLGREMQSTARYIGLYDERLKTVREPVLTPQMGTAMLQGVTVFPCYIGCKQFNSPKYEARPLYALYNNGGTGPFNIRLQRDYFNDRERIWVDDVTDMEGNTVDGVVDLRLQTLASDDEFWMDKGAFTLTIQAK